VTYKPGTSAVAPTVAAHADAGTGATATVSSGSRIAMRVAVTTGTSPVAGGQLCTLTYATAWSVTPFPICTPLTDPAADIGAYAQGLSTTTVGIRCTAVLLPATTYEFYVHVLGA
jgi:hypothetical protein